MKNILLIVITITFSIKCYGQISKGQDKLLNKAYQKNSPKLLLKFIEKWQADVKYSENDIKNDTLKCIYEMAKDILNDHSRNITGLLFHTFDTTMYRILLSDISYVQVDDLNFDNAVAREILKYYMPIGVFTPLAISYLYNKKRTSSSKFL